uniref:Glucose-6-phosphate isomerase n=1 Tax=Anopheles coluzzii TaxID=1518534 RepID=A0A8W7P6H0_ANOCL
MLDDSKTGINHSPVWARLHQHQRATRFMQMRELFQTDAQRFQRFSLRLDGVLLDYSKNRITERTLELLIDLAHEADLPGWMQRMRSGERINVSERRSVLHTALRLPESSSLLLDGQDVVPEVHAVLQRMRVFCDKVRSGQWLGYTGQPIRDVVNLGIGGSDLGPLVVKEALSAYAQPTLNVHFVSNVDGQHIAHYSYYTLLTCTHSLGQFDGIERSYVFYIPAQRNHVAHCQLGVEGGDRLFDDETGITTGFHADTHVVAQVDEFPHASGEAVLLLCHVQIDTFRADGQRYRRARGSVRSPSRLSSLPYRRVFSPMKVGNKGIARVLVQALRAVDLLDFALGEHCHAVGHGERFALVVGHVHHGHAQAFVQMLDFHLHVFAQLLVQCAQRFIHQHQLRFEYQGTGQGHTLLLAAGHLAGVAVGKLVQLHHGQGALDPLGDIGLVHATHFQREGQVFGYGHVREQCVVLEHHADVALVRRHAVERTLTQHDLAGSRGFEAGQHHQAGGLAGAGRTQQGKEFALADVQIEILHDQGLAVVALLYVLEADQDVACVRFSHDHSCLNGEDWIVKSG